MANNSYNDKKGRYEVKPVTLETCDQAVYDYFDKRLQVMVDTDKERKKVPIVFATGERWKLARDRKELRDENGTLILPIITVRRISIDRTPGMSSMGQEVPSIVISSEIHSKTGNIQNLVEQRKRSGFPEMKKPVVREYLTIPFPDFCVLRYEISIWSQYLEQMNEILEKIFYNYDHMDSFIMPVEYDGNKRKGKGYYFVGFREGDIVPETNIEDFTDQERIMRYTYSIKTPVYLMLDPKDESLAYGKNKGNLRNDDGSKVVIKAQNSIEVKMKESVMTLEDFLKLNG